MTALAGTTGSQDTDTVQVPPAPTTFDSLNPATGEVVETFPIHTAEDVAAAVSRARDASQWWQELGFDGRKRYLKAWRAVIAQRIDELAELMHRENGKPVNDAIGEISLAIEHLDWAAGHASKVLGRHRVSAGLLAMNHTASIRYLPYGVVGVIGPWNYPIHTPMGSISYALAAGNTVVFKPSEYTPAVGKWIADRFTEITGKPVFQVITGLGATGAALCRSGVDKIAFTGSAATGRKIMAACADTLTPVVIEGGGKDALIVADDADVAKAVEAGVWGGLANAGQTCVGVERVYVHESVYDDFVAQVKVKAGELRAGNDAKANYGPMTMPSQIDVVRRHIDAAIASGGTAIVGGPESVQPPYVQPVVFTDVPEDSSAVREETFGPTLTIKKVASNDEAVRLANDSNYGLGAAVFSKDKGNEIANKLRSGMVSINSVITFAMVPSLPFGGVGESGFGRIHGADGLREFAYPQGQTKLIMQPPIRVTSFDRPDNAIPRLKLLMKQMYGRSRGV
jgi:aldehyde dehydrogenase (NAD+)